MTCFGTALPPATIIVLVLIAVSLLGCANEQTKIEPPPNVIGTTKEMSAKAAANALSSAISGGELSGHYQNAVNNTYQTVGQDDVAFYLLLQAYNAEIARGNAAGAAEILQRAREELARRHDQPPPPPAVAATSKRLTKTEEHVLRKLSLKGAIASKLAGPTDVDVMGTRPSAYSGNELWPPPIASASEVLPRKLFTHGNENIPDGFAIASRIEHINDDGSFAADRWAIEVPAIRQFSVRAYVRALFRAPAGRYRVIVFVVTDIPFRQSPKKLTGRRATDLTSGGFNQLPQSTGRADFSASHNCTALIYEFSGGNARTADNILVAL